MLMLVSEVAKQDPKGPWAEAKTMCKDPLMMDAFSMCISHLHVFVPNHLLLDNKLQVILWPPRTCSRIGQTCLTEVGKGQT